MLDFFGDGKMRQAEDDIDALVYQLFDLTPQKIDLLAANI